MDRRRVIEKEEYTKLFFNTYSKSLEIKTPETIENKYQRSLETKKLCARRKELTSLGLIYKPKTKYFIDFKGIYEYIIKKICCFDEKLPSERIAYIEFEALFSKYLNNINNINNTLKEIFEGFVQAWNQVIEKSDKKSRLNTIEHDTKFSVEEISLMNETHLIFTLACNNYFYGDKPTTINKSRTKKYAYEVLC